MTQDEIPKSTEVEIDLHDEGPSVRRKMADPAKLPAILARLARFRPKPSDQVEWLIEFEKEDLDDTRPAKELLALGKEAGEVFGLGRDLQTGEVRHVHEKTQACFKALRLGQEWKFQPTENQTAVLLPLSRRGLVKRGKGGVILLWDQDSGRPIDRFLLNALRALDAVRDRFRLCDEAGCPEFFVARKRQELCGDHATERLKKRMSAVAKRRLKERAEIRKRRERRRTGRTANKKVPRGRTKAQRQGR
jgi:hypothetical protein